MHRVPNSKVQPRCLPAGWYIAHAYVVVLYIVSPVDSWINIRIYLMRIYFVKVSLFILHCICHCKNTVYYIISVVIMNMPFVSFFSQNMHFSNERCQSHQFPQHMFIFVLIIQEMKKRWLFSFQLCKYQYLLMLHVNTLRYFYFLMLFLLKT